MNTDKYLNDLFDSARNAKPLVSTDEISSQLKSDKTISNSRKQLITTKTPIIMTISILLLGGLYLFFAPVKIEKVAKTESAKIKNEIINPITEINKPENEKPDPKVKPPRQKNPTILSIRKPNKLSVAKESTPIHNHEDEHIIIPYTPNYIPPGNISTNRCLTVNNRAIDMVNIHLIELTKEELLKLGISVKNKEIEITSSGGREGEAPLKSVYSKYGSKFETVTLKVIKRDSVTDINISHHGMPVKSNADSLLKQTTICENKELVFKILNDNDSIHQEMNHAELGDYPDYSLITDDLGQLWRSYKINYKVMDKDSSGRKLSREEMKEKATKLKLQAEKELRSRIASLVPVLVRSGEENKPEELEKGVWRADIIVWFEPTEKLFKALPERISNEMKIEYQSVFVEKEASSCKYFEACKDIPGVIESFLVYPNPSEDLVSMEFNLKETRLLSASLYTINGLEVKSIFKDQTIEKGYSKHEIHINDLPQGIYLLMVASNGGDVITKRIIRR